MELIIPPKLEFLFQDHRYRGLKGGRGSMKSHTTATAIAVKVMGRASRGLSTRVLATREYQVSIAESAKKLIEKKFVELGYGDFIDAQSAVTVLPFDGRIIYKGLQDMHSLQSLEDIDITWLEEGHTAKRESLQSLFATVIRKPGSNFYATWNPQTENDPIRVLLQELQDGGEDVILEHINYMENPYCPEELRDQARVAKLTNDDDYRHIWLGLPKTDDENLKTIPRHWLEKCVEAWGLYTPDAGRKFAGHDVAESADGDFNAWACRHGSALFAVERWRPEPAIGSAPKVHRFMLLHGATRVFYDAGGVGAPLKRDFAKLLQSDKREKAYRASPFLFGGAVYGEDDPFIKAGKDTVTNGQFFSKVNAQAWWNVRLRAQNTVRLMAGESVDLERCLFINPEIANLHELLDQLSLCTWTENSNAKIVVDKYGGGTKSPDMADAVIQAFVNDIEKRGLRA